MGFLRMFTRHQALIAGLVVVLGLSAAACASAPPPSSAMRLGAFTAAPDGFIDFCRRQPRECGVVETAVAPPAVAVVAEAAPLGINQPADEPVADWAADFASLEAPLIKASAPQLASLSLQPLLGAADWDFATGATGSTQRFDWSEVFAREDSAPAAAPAATLEPAAVTPIMAPAVAPTLAYAMDAALWAKLNRVNTRINRAIVRSTDAAAYGVEELWSLPIENGQKYGDCEDYVLEKRLALIADGVPPAALSIAVVDTTRGDRHAVLVVATDQGDYVLDNLTPWVLPWGETHYRWLARQTALGPYSWALVTTS